MQRQRADSIVYLCSFVVGMLLSVAAAAQLETATSSDAADLARDIADSATYAKETSTRLGSSGDKGFVDLTNALEQFAKLTESGGTSDEIRRAHDETIFALARLSRNPSNQGSGTSSIEGQMFLENIRALGKYAADADGTAASEALP